jgi:hypothetical protein
LLKELIVELAPAEAGIMLIDDAFFIGIVG